jgi:hypothetical protein
MDYGKSYTKEGILQAFRTCLDTGLTFFDTAPGYGRGESERLLGECRREDGRSIPQSQECQTGEGECRDIGLAFVRRTAPTHQSG